MRDKTLSRFLGFAFLGTLMSPQAWAQPDREIVLVNGTPIRQSEVLTRLWRRYGPDMLDEMIDELLLRQAAGAQKIKADPAEVDKRLSRLRAQFGDPKIFESQLQQSGTSVQKLREDIADQLAREQLIIKERHLSVKDAEIKKAFEAHRAELGTAPSIHLRHILVKTEAEAKELMDKIKAGSDFTQMAREKSLAPTGKLNGGDYGFVSKGMLPADIEAIAFTMKPKEMRVVPSPKGFHILQALETKGPVPAEFNKVKDNLREMLLEEKLKTSLPDYLKELRQKAEIKPQGS